MFGEEKYLTLKNGERMGKLWYGHILREETTVTRIHNTAANTVVPEFHHRAAVFKQGKLLLLAVNQKVNKVCTEALLTSEELFIVHCLFNFDCFT